MLNIIKKDNLKIIKYETKTYRKYPLFATLCGAEETPFWDRFYCYVNPSLIHHIYHLTTCLYNFTINHSHIAFYLYPGCSIHLIAGFLAPIVIY